MWDESLKQKIIKIFILGLLPILFFNLTLLVKEEMRSGFVSKRLGIEYNKERSTKFFREYNEKFDFVLVDSPAGVEDGFKNALAACKEAIVVTNPELSAVRDADRVIGILNTSDIEPIF